MIETQVWKKKEKARRNKKGNKRKRLLGKHRKRKKGQILYLKLTLNQFFMSYRQLDFTYLLAGFFIWNILVIEGWREIVVQRSMVKS